MHESHVRFVLAFRRNTTKFRPFRSTERLVVDARVAEAAKLGT